MIDWDEAPTLAELADERERVEGPPCEECGGSGIDRSAQRSLVRSGYTWNAATREAMCEPCSGTGVQDEDA